MYKTGGVDLVREQIAAALPESIHAYDIDEQGLVVWPEASFDVEVRYDFREGATMVPKIVAADPQDWLPVLDRQAVVFSATKISWRNWVETWRRDEAGEVHLENLGPEVIGASSRVES